MNLRVPRNAGDLLTGRGTVSFSRSTPVRRLVRTVTVDSALVQPAHNCRQTVHWCSQHTTAARQYTGAASTQQPPDSTLVQPAHNSRQIVTPAAHTKYKDRHHNNDGSPPPFALHQRAFNQVRFVIPHHLASYVPSLS